MAVNLNDHCSNFLLLGVRVGVGGGEKRCPFYFLVFSVQ